VENVGAPEATDFNARQHQQCFQPPTKSLPETKEGGLTLNKRFANG
jgi:hypothetical protein